MELNLEINKQLKTKIFDEITNLKKDVEAFNYKDLRAVRTHNSSVKFRATEESVNKLFSMFATKFIHSKDDQIRNYFNKLEKQPRSEEVVMLQLAESLLTFREKIEQSEDEYFQTSKNGTDLGKLARNSNWVIRFQFLIEMHLQEMKVNQNYYLQFVKCIKKLSEKVYLWIETHKLNPDLLEKYSYLQSSNHETFKEKFSYDSQDKAKAKRRLSTLFDTLDNTHNSLERMAKKIETEAEEQFGIKSTKKG